MVSIWVVSIERSLSAALEFLAAAIRDCPDERWVTPMWLVPEPGAEHQFLGAEWLPITGAARRPVPAMG